MKFFGNFLLIILVVILQSTFVPKIIFFNSFPNLILIIALSLLFIRRTEEALWWGLIGGLLLDLISPVRFGIYTFSILTIFIIAYIITDRIFSDPTLPLSILLFFVASLLSNIIFFLLTFNYYVLISEAIYSAVVGCIIYGLIKYYFQPKESIKI